MPKQKNILIQSQLEIQSQIFATPPLAVCSSCFCSYFLFLLPLCPSLLPPPPRCLVHLERSRLLFHPPNTPLCNTPTHIHALTDARTHTYTRPCTHTYTRPCTHTYTRPCTHKRTHKHTHTHTHTCPYTHVDAQTHSCTNTHT